MDRVPVPAPIALLTSILPDVVVFNETSPLFVAIPSRSLTWPIIKFVAVSLNENASPALVIDAANVPTALPEFSVTFPFWPVTSKPAAEMMAVCPIVPTALNDPKPAPAPMVALTSRLPEVVVDRATSPPLVVIPATVPTVPTTRFVAVSLNWKYAPPEVTDAATVPTWLS